MTTGWIYLISDEQRRVKIGYADNIARRFTQLQIGNADELDLIAFFPGSLKTERDTQELFEHLHLRGEWYRCAPEIVDYFNRFSAAAA